MAQISLSLQVLPWAPVSRSVLRQTVHVKKSHRKKVSAPTMPVEGDEAFFSSSHSQGATTKVCRSSGVTPYRHQI